MDDLDTLVEQAEQLFKEKKLEEALQFYNEAGLAYRKKQNAKKAAQCFVRAAQCVKIRTGYEPLLEAAHFSEMAALEALKDKDYAFARWQFREAGLLFEREGDFEKYSRCFTESQDAFLEYLFYVFSTGKKQESYKAEPGTAGALERLGALGLAGLGFISKAVWGYGEQPFRTVLSGLVIILGAAVLYCYGGDSNFGGILRPANFHEALYLSGVTFSTVGYGDVTPMGWLRYVALLEALAGMVMSPLLVIALTRRYLRVYR